MTSPPTAPVDAAERATYAALLRRGGYRAVVVLQLALVLGTSLQILALSLLVYARTGSALWSGIAFAAGFFPQLVGGTLLTSLADRLPARPLLAAGAAVRTAAAALLAAVDLSPAVAIAVVAAVAVVTPVPAAAQSALVSTLLTGDLYVLGRSVFTVVSSGSQLVGLGIGGAIAAALGPHATLWLAAGFQAAGLLAVARVPRVARPVAGTERWRLNETWHANRTLLQHTTVRRILLSWWLPSALLVGAESLVVAYVGEAGGSPAAVGILLAAFPAGMAVGDVVVGRWVPEHRRVVLAPVLVVVMGLALLPALAQPPTVALAGCFALASVAGAYQLCGQRTFLAAVPVERRGVAFGLVGTGTMTFQGLGPVLAGGIASGLGASPTMALLGGVIVVLALAFGRLPATAASASAGGDLS